MRKDKIINKRGFTLVELLIVVAVIAVLVGIAIPIFLNRLEESRRAVDKSNAKNIVVALSNGMNSGDIAFHDATTADGKPRCVAVVVGKNKMTSFVSGSVTINGQSYDNSESAVGHERIQQYLEKMGIGDYTIHSKDPDDNGWAFYAVFLYSDGTVKIGSGTSDDSSDYRDDTFENHAFYWKNRTSNIEKEMNQALNKG